jgi:type IV secretory pathway VirB2 component (pilin)
MIKKLSCIFLTIFALFPNLAQAQLSFNGILPGGDRTNWNWSTLGETIGNIAELALILAAGVAIIFVIIGGYQYIFSFGNPEAIEHAKNTIIWAIVGLVLALSSVLIIQYVESFVGGASNLNVPEASAPQAPDVEVGDPPTKDTNTDGDATNEEDANNISNSGDQLEGN